ncbi:hypothetical protein [Nostoc sp.]
MPTKQDDIINRAELLQEAIATLASLPFSPALTRSSLATAALKACPISLI